MTTDEEYRHKSLRLPAYDYTQAGFYFITFVTYHRTNLFGAIIDGQMIINLKGKIVAEEWQRTAILRPYVKLDISVIMPNHFHGILVIQEDDHYKKTAPDNSSNLVQSQRNGPAPMSLGAIVGLFKSSSARRINSIGRTPGLPVWQRNYYEHVIRSEKELDRIRQYILENPLRWELDEENPDFKINPFPYKPGK